MDENIVEQRKRATEVFKLGARALKVAVHRTMNQPPKGDGWVQCWNSPPGLMC